MSNMFSKLTTDGLEETQDRLGGYQPFDTAIYPATIKMAYAGQSSGGAMSVTVVADCNGKEYRETLYVTNKKGENFFLNKNDNTKKVPLPGFTVVDDICLITTGEPLSAQKTEEKTVKLWDSEQKKEMPKAVEMLTGLIGQKVKLGIIRQLENKSEKDSNGVYQPTAETRETNFIDKVFHPEMDLTVAEARDGQETAKFHDSWAERNNGQIRDKREIKDGEGGKTGAPPKSGGSSSSPAPRQSLFGNKQK